MGSFLFLATEAHGEGGFGLNLDIWETNLINLSILIGALVYFGSKLVGKTMSERHSRIAEAIQEAEGKQRQAAEALADQQQKLAQAQAEAERIRKAAEESAKAAKEAIIAQGEQDIKRLKEAAVQDLNTERERALAELRQRVAAMAMTRVEEQLKSQLDEAAQQTLIDRSIGMLGGRS
ncbi:MAG TPA: ATP synthase F0 subunit B [Cyanobacteria bacterium UBA8803]|nr:ATP synthase F0 subunit B [Cyanobacteria bacterium UBA9273]HBL58538.1 ATP synthase F0 subunit B [Cyanobacteria bacterium UBA8803]